MIIEKHQGYEIDIQARATVPLLTSFAAAGAIPWGLFAKVKLQPKSPWMRLTPTQFQDTIDRYCKNDSSLLTE